MFSDLVQISPGPLTVALILAALPIIIWMNLLFNKDHATKITLLKVFIFGALSVVPLMIIQYSWLMFSDVGLYSTIEHSVNQVHLGFLMTFIAVGVFEEVTKFNMVRHLKWAKIEIKTINEAIRYLFVIALGFAFTENIFYFYSIAGSGQFNNLVAAFMFRSTFTAAAHMVFSGIVGYYYAIGKFGNPVLELDKWTGHRHKALEWIQNKIGLKSKSLFHLGKTMQGLFFAMALHAAFNFSLQLNKISYAAAIVVAGFALVLFLSKKRMTYLVFTEEEKARPSTIGKQEEDVVIELMGMWLNEEKYTEVIEICGRLSARDPDNDVVKLFRAKAIDLKKIARVKRAINLLFSEEDYDIEQEEMSLFERLKKNQEQQQKMTVAVAAPKKKSRKKKSKKKNTKKR
jgi:protease PrsW